MAFLCEQIKVFEYTFWRSVLIFRIIILTRRSIFQQGCFRRVISLCPKSPSEVSSRPYLFAYCLNPLKMQSKRKSIEKYKTLFRTVNLLKE